MIHTGSTSLRVVDEVAVMQAFADQLRASGRRVALVPTMGALHAGHLALVREARRHGDAVLVSVFVNPTQFAEGEDLDRYPRRLDADLRMLEESSVVAAVFAPSVVEMYPGGTGTDEGMVVDVAGLDRHLCGAHRPGHFRGVATVVLKLFNACKPHVAFFGLKDAQQLVILRRMVLDLLLDVQVVGVQTVREPDGLALSSRNEYLSADERKEAVALSRAVAAAEEAIRRGEQASSAIVETMLRIIERAPLARLQYAEVVDARTLQPTQSLSPGSEVLAAVAVYFGNTRLIDSAFVRVP